MELSLSILPMSNDFVPIDLGMFLNYSLFTLYAFTRLHIP